MQIDRQHQAKPKSWALAGGQSGASYILGPTL